MKPFLQRFWMALRSRVRYWLGEEPEPAPAPPDLEPLRRNVAAMCALASKTRMEMASLVKQHDAWDAETKTLLKDGREDEARSLLVQLAESEARIEELLRQHEAQRHAAEAAVVLFHQAESKRTNAQTALKKTEQLEKAAFRAETLASSVPLLEPSRHSEPAPSAIDSSTYRSPVVVARELLQHPSYSERTTP